MPKPKPKTCGSIPRQVRSVLLAHAVGEPDLAVVLKGICVLEPVQAVDARGGEASAGRGGSSAGVAVRGQRRGGSSVVVATRWGACARAGIPTR